MKIASLKRWNVLDVFLVLSFVLIAASFYFTFVQPIRFSNVIQREGTPRYVIVEMALVEDPRLDKDPPPIGYERPDVYGRALWKMLEWHETIKEGKRSYKTRVKVLAKEMGSGEIYYGQYLLNEGQTLVLSGTRYGFTGLILNCYKLEEKVLF